MEDSAFQRSELVRQRGQQGWRKALLKQWEEFACFGSNARISWKIWSASALRPPKLGSSVTILCARWILEWTETDSNSLYIIHETKYRIWILQMHIHHLDHCQRLNMTTCSYMHLKIWSKVPTEEMHILAPHGAGRCTAAAAKADLNVAICYAEAQKAVSAPNATTSGFTSPIEFLKKLGTHCQCSGLPGFPCLDDSRISASAFCKEPNKAGAAAGIYKCRQIWETSQTSIIN